MRTVITLIRFPHHSSGSLFSKGTTCFRPPEVMPDYKTPTLKLMWILLKASVGAGFCPVFPGTKTTQCGDMQSPLLSPGLSGQAIPCKCWMCSQMLGADRLYSICCHAASDLTQAWSWQSSGKPSQSSRKRKTTLRKVIWYPHIVIKSEISPFLFKWNQYLSLLRIFPSNTTQMQEWE